MKQCQVEGCSRQCYAKGFCNAHYMRARKGTSLSLPINHRLPRNRQCEIEGCANEVGPRGGQNRCSKHLKNYLHDTRKHQLVELLGGKCMKCHHTYQDVVYDFHHRDPKTKCFGLGAELINKSIEELLEEAAKCDLLCANCHREETYCG